MIEKLHQQLQKQNKKIKIRRIEAKFTEKRGLNKITIEKINGIRKITGSKKIARTFVRIIKAKSCKIKVRNLKTTKSKIGAIKKIEVINL